MLEDQNLRLQQLAILEVESEVRLLCLDEVGRETEVAEEAVVELHGLGVLVEDGVLVVPLHRQVLLVHARVLVLYRVRARALLLINKQLKAKGVGDG